MSWTLNLLPWFWKIIVTTVDRMSEERLNKAYPCQYCGMSFAQNWLLKRCPSWYLILSWSFMSTINIIKALEDPHGRQAVQVLNLHTHLLAARLLCSPSSHCPQGIGNALKLLLLVTVALGDSLPAPLLLSANQSAVAGGLRRCLWLSRGPGWPWRQLRSGTGNRLWACSLPVKYGFETICINSVSTILSNM